MQHQHEFIPNAALQQQQILCPPESTLWMGDLKPEWDAHFIREAFGENAGDRSTYCFVEFRDGPSARTAMLRVNGMTLPNDPTGTSRFNLAFANSPHQMSIEYNLFVNNLAPDVDDVALFRLFGERYMSCRGAKVYRHEDGASKEQGFVRFTSETDQQKALVELNKHKFHGRELYLKLARPKTRGGPGDKRFGYGGHGGGLGMGPSGYGAGGFGQSTQMIPQNSMQMMLPFHSTIPTPAVAPHQAMPMIAPMPYGMVSAGGTSLAIATPFGSQMAPNHGVAGFGRPLQTSGQQFMGPPLILGYSQNSAGFPPNYAPAPLVQQGPMVAPMGGPFQTGIIGPPQFKQVPPTHNIMANLPPPQPIYEAGSESYFYMGEGTFPFSSPSQLGRTKGIVLALEHVEPLSAAEHNAILYNSSAEFHIALEASRWNAVGFFPDTKRKELYNMLHTG